MTRSFSLRLIDLNCSSAQAVRPICKENKTITSQVEVIIIPPQNLDHSYSWCSIHPTAAVCTCQPVPLILHVTFHVTYVRVKQHNMKLYRIHTIIIMQTHRDCVPHLHPERGLPPFSALSIKPCSPNKINPGQNIFIVQKCQTCVVVAKQTVTNNIYMEEVCISAASQSTACLSLHQSKDNEGSPHCNYQTMCLSVTSHKYE